MVGARCTGFATAFDSHGRLDRLERRKGDGKDLSFGEIRDQFLILFYILAAFLAVSWSSSPARGEMRIAIVGTGVSGLSALWVRSSLPSTWTVIFWRCD